MLSIVKYFDILCDRQTNFFVGRLLLLVNRTLCIEELKARREHLEASRDVARTRVEQLMAEEMDCSRKEKLGDDIDAFAATLRSGLDQLDFEGRRRFVRLLIERVVVNGENVAIEHAIPLSGRFAGL